MINPPPPTPTPQPPRVCVSIINSFNHVQQLNISFNDDKCDIHFYVPRILNGKSTILRHQISSVIPNRCVSVLDINVQQTWTIWEIYTWLLVLLMCYETVWSSFQNSPQTTETYSKTGLIKEMTFFCYWRGGGVFLK